MRSGSRRSFGSYCKNGTRQQSICSLRELAAGPSTDKKKTLSASKHSNIVEERPEADDKTTLTPLLRQILMQKDSAKQRKYPAPIICASANTSKGRNST